MVAASVVILLGTIPVLIPLLGTRDDGGVVPPARLAVEPGVPDLPGGQLGTEPAPEEPPLAAAGAFVPLTATPSPTPSATPAPSSPAPSRPAPTLPATPAASSQTTTTPPPPTTLVAQPDLVVLSVSWTPVEPAAGEPVTFTAVVRNAGDAATPEATHEVGFDVDGTAVSWSSAETAPLAPGEERAYTADGGPAGSTWTAVAGEHALRAYVDDANRIGETNDGNNALTTTLTVP